MPSGWRNRGGGQELPGGRPVTWAAKMKASTSSWRKNIQLSLSAMIGEVETKIQALLIDGQETDRAAMGQEVELVLDKTPFYAESGGQVADTGTITGSMGAVEVADVQRPVEGLIIHKGRVTSGLLQTGDTVMATVY